MISVLTLTYQRHHILEEAIESFIRQDFDTAEMVIINDSPNVIYGGIDNPYIHIINVRERFATIGEKLEFGMKECWGDYVYRLDDDDMLGPNALQIASDHIAKNPGFDIYRSREHYQFWDDKYLKTTDSINTGNIFSREYINRIEFPKRSADEDAVLLFELGASISTIENPTMIYRWNSNTYHISTHLHLENENRLTGNPNIKEQESGFIELQPHFNVDYWGQVRYLA